MNKLRSTAMSLIVGTAFMLILSSCSSKKTLEITSPGNNIKVSVSCTDQGILQYTVYRNDQIILEPSRLGVRTSLGDFASHLTIDQTSEITKVSEQYDTPTEKRYHNTYQANEQQITVRNSKGDQLVVIFRVSDDGVAFRYFFPALDSSGSLTVLNEYTTFKFPESGKGWLHPQADAKTGWCRTQPSYEENYKIDVPVGTQAPWKGGWSFPALFKSGDTWALISESGVEPPYCGSRLAQDSPKGEYAISFPQPGETVDSTDLITPVSKTPFYSAWRTIIVGSLARVVESNMISALAAPCRVQDTTWIKPGISSWSWGVLKDESVNYKTSKEFIDLASQMGWSYCLIDADWDRRIGYEKVQELVNYAKTRNIGIILWYNSSGNWNTTVYSPKSMLVDSTSRNKEFERISAMGVKGIKVDFWPGDGPSAIQYYYDMMRDAARYKLMVNFHGTTVPRGWSRTFPNLASMEAVKGFEYTTFTQENNDANAVHCAMLPFTRNAVGHMDYTPVCFCEIPNIVRKTSNAFELALSVVFQSGIQHIVEIPTDMSKQPEFVRDFMKSLPARWDDVKLLDGYPGEYVVMARRTGNHWYIAGINAKTEAKSLTIDLSSFNPPASVTIITDGANNRSFENKTCNLKNGSLTVQMDPLGGFALIL